MIRDTAEVIRRLAADGGALRPLRRPWSRAATWGAWSLAYLAAVFMVWPHAALGAQADRRFMVEQMAALATGLTAAAAAFGTVVPGQSRALTLVPIPLLGVWLSSLGQRCADEWATSAGLRPVLMHWPCLPVTVLVGLVPALSIVVMLRRGAPLTPRLTTALAALAVAGLANVGVRLIHPFDASFVVLTWHVTAVLMLSVTATALGEHVFSWRRVTAAADINA